MIVLDARKARGEAVQPWTIFADNELSHDPVQILDAARTFFREHAQGTIQEPVARIGLGK